VGLPVLPELELDPVLAAGPERLSSSMVAAQPAASVAATNMLLLQLYIALTSPVLCSERKQI